MAQKEVILEGAFVVGKEILRSGEIPSIAVYGETVPEAWESAVLATWEFGVGIPTEYDQDIDPDSKDATVMISIAKPLKEPRIHRNLPCGLDDLYVYTREVVEGVHDQRVGEGGWSYSYHDRLRNWPGIGSWEKIDELVGKELELPHVDQLNVLVNKLAEVPHSRRAQAISWTPFVDSTHHEPPCLQRIWCRVVRSEEDLYLLQMNTHWRSRDAYKAAFENIYAITELQGKLASEISEISGRKVEPGRYIDVSDSFHIYGSYIRKGELEWFMSLLDRRSLEDRVWDTNDPIVQDEFELGRKLLEGSGE